MDKKEKMAARLQIPIYSISGEDIKKARAKTIEKNHDSLIERFSTLIEKYGIPKSIYVDIPSNQNSENI